MENCTHPSKATRPPIIREPCGLFSFRQGGGVPGAPHRARCPASHQTVGIGIFHSVSALPETDDGHPLSRIAGRGGRVGTFTPRLASRFEGRSQLPTRPEPQHGGPVWRIVEDETLSVWEPSDLLMSTTDGGPSPEGSDWGEAEARAYEAIHSVKPGDMVLWADRKVAMEVMEVETDDGDVVVTADKPRGEGHYHVRERYKAGRPAYTSEIGRANDFHIVEAAPEERGLTEEQFEELTERLSENATDAFMRLDYGEWGEAVSDVVEDWSEDVAYRRWAGYRHHPDWEDGDPDAIYESVLEHTVRDSHSDEGDLTLREQAEVVLFDRVYTLGRQQAEASIVTDSDDYRELVDTLSHHTIDRFDRKNYSDARVAVRDTVSDWVDDRQEPAFQSVIEYGNDRFADEDYYEVEDEVRERAFDIIDHEVWEEVNRLQRERGKHDPTIRGLTYADYTDLVDFLAGKTMRQYPGDGLVRTTTKTVVQEWADDVEARQWDGHRHRVYADGDVEDIFASVAIHADNDPTVFNPFSRSKERKLAVQALIPDVTKAAKNAIDERGEPETRHEANEYVQQTLGMDDTSYDELHEASSEEFRAFLERAVSQVEGNEVGWTFVDECVEAGMVVPESTNDWTLIDYGVIREGDRVRKLAWFDRETGDLLVLSGIPDEDDEGNPAVFPDSEPFHVQRIEMGDETPDFMLSDATLAQALDFVYDYVDADQADLRVIEDAGDIRVHDAITDDDINASGVLDALVPNISMGVEDLETIADVSVQGASGFLRNYWTELTGVAALAALVTGHWYVGGALVGTNLKPSIHKRKGVGLKGSKQFGAGKRGQGVGGEFETEFYVRNSTFSSLAQKHAPRFLERGFSEGDMGKGVVVAGGEALDTFRESLAYSFEDDAVPEIRRSDLDSMSLEELQALADRTDRTYRDEQYEDKETLRKTLWGYAEHYEPDTVSWGQAFLDTYGGSVERLEAIFRRGTIETMEERSVDAEQNVAAQNPEAMDELDMNVEYDSENFSWADLRKTELGISGVMLRGLEAEDVVAGADYLNIEGWLSDRIDSAVRYGSEFVTREAPSFEDWEQARFGPGQPAGPEEEARRRARFYKEVAGARDPPDAYDALGIDTDAQGDYDNTAYDFDDTFGDNFEDVADRYADATPPEDEQ